MIAFTYDRFQHVKRWTYFWSDRGANSPSLRQKSRWRGALSIYWRLPRLIRAGVCLGAYPDGMTDATTWTGRPNARQIIGLDGFLAIYLRTPCGERYSWEVGREIL